VLGFEVAPRGSPVDLEDPDGRIVLDGDLCDDDTTAVATAAASV
jgi:hypothetical protein